MNDEELQKRDVSRCTENDWFDADNPLDSGVRRSVKISEATND